jgi:hypothetical protein
MKLQLEEKRKNRTHKEREETDHIFRFFYYKLNVILYLKKITRNLNNYTNTEFLSETKKNIWILNCKNIY